jgi:hypothetical protein
MHPIIQKTFGGLSKAYFFRQFFFGLAFFALLTFVVAKSPQGMPVGQAAFFVVNTLLYPYSRFVYESVVSFIMGKNVFFASAFFMMAVKFITMTVCWIGAIFIAPIGLAYLYYHHTKNDRV